MLFGLGEADQRRKGGEVDTKAEMRWERKRVVGYVQTNASSYPARAGVMLRTQHGRAWCAETGYL